jgi:glycosyltransferase involved in cell wall biosynthesis
VSLAAVIICQNEEKNIQRCISSCHEVCDEIIVVDSFSTDKTKVLASQYDNVKYYERQFDNYINQKNFANEKSQSAYILSLDADEYIGGELAQFLGTNSYQDYDAIEVLRINYIGNTPVRHGIWSNDRKIRIWKKELAIWTGTLPHEHIEIVPDANVFNSNLIVHHNAYANFEQLYSKSMHYAAMASDRYCNLSYFALFLALILNPPIKFVKGYFFKGGYRDGIYGWKIAKVSFIETFYKYQLAIEKKWKD